MSRRHNFSGTEFTDRGEGIPRKQTSGMASGQQSLGINPNTYLSKQSTRTPTSQQYQTESQYMYRGSDYRKEQPVGTANRPHDFESDLYPKQTGKNITQRRKDTIANSDELIAQLLSENEKLKARLEEEKTMKQEALKLSWLMNVQDPPMSILSYLDPGSPISKELRQYFTLYNTSSEVVDHVVWPAVLLQENGAIISKGVIQGK
ncbi:hypothetical protein KUTeg_024087 [Tegillarca granosa]|uniref:Mitochondria-eating protein C-terminal domain-containing protein n=1 Tax=Tegillarca granosa TaxID=220873 RepID=A0ABQ9DZE3_TEGGR|nr:hypothetical protein KUTeg_024087 [Tegillarca granosa]